MHTFNSKFIETAADTVQKVYKKMKIIQNPKIKKIAKYDPTGVRRFRKPHLEMIEKVIKRT